MKYLNWNIHKRPAHQKMSRAYRAMMKRQTTRQRKEVSHVKPL